MSGQDEDTNQISDPLAALVPSQDVVVQDPNQFFQNVNPAFNPAILSMFLQTNGVEQPSQSGYVRGSWTQQEDDQLKSAVQQLGSKKWSDIARFVPTRSGKQCRERWYDRLCPELKHGPFEPYEDQIIVEKQREIGNRWAIIAQSLPGRSPGSIKNRWYSGLRNNQSSIQAHVAEHVVNVQAINLDAGIMGQIGQIGSHDHQNEEL